MTKSLLMLMQIEYCGVYSFEYQQIDAFIQNIAQTDIAHILSAAYRSVA